MDIHGLKHTEIATGYWKHQSQPGRQDIMLAVTTSANHGNGQGWQEHHITNQQVGSAAKTSISTVLWQKRNGKFNQSTQKGEIKRQFVHCGFAERCLHSFYSGDWVAKSISASASIQQIYTDIAPVDCFYWKHVAIPKQLALWDSWEPLPFRRRRRSSRIYGGPRRREIAFLNTDLFTTASSISTN